ncbi:hypothetical protein HDV05_004871 [Chytridiales sp. JEL 0842]|nr:hypothetical protein HDV05_004871 [Chytridiales sp. JEL 0842]
MHLPALVSLLLGLATTLVSAQGNTTTTTATLASTTTTAPAATTAPPAPPASPVPPVPPSSSNPAPLEPPNGKLYLGAWLFTDDHPDGRDTPADFNRRIGYNAAAIQKAQSIPLAPNPFSPGEFLSANMTALNDNTNAALFLTVYPDQTRSNGSGLGLITDYDINLLVDQINTVKRVYNRDVFLRFAPEMNGAWMLFGVQPDAYKAMWIRISNALKARAPSAAMVWSPNFWAGAGDDYAPYWPGAEYVDWVGLSVYWKGFKGAYPWITNTEAPRDYMAQIIDAAGPEGGTVSFYQNYAERYNKPMMISECAGTYHVNYSSNGVTFLQTDPGAGRVRTVNSFFDSFLNADFFRRYPRIKMVNLFEYLKEENDSGTRIWRDFRATTDPATLAAFKAHLDNLNRENFMVWATTNPVTTSTATRTGTPTGTAPVSTTQGSGASGLKFEGSKWALVGSGVAGVLGLILGAMVI